ncbi:putative tripeptidyl-peptidase protein [Phaeoacremonium minimum UCRPA7]|uniref:tripeptidyl-peptidase II n=1 Tax=Phaeoacremonium minimum (strain UCR-PA7) TaxID=1286976 RepID=R8BTR4_PHAM7|nr:putative tripeptidyl-peptidase protein [Phaeoacremonium minimum UCRPA7]EOO02778.1 putative tripeptidyl-peptidase protein [Phaeoacremonium minimum UCRPA7]
MRSQLLFCTAFAALQSLVEGSDVVLESLREVPQGWKRLRDADPEQSIKLRIALEQPNLDLFEQTLYDISSPDHPKYGQHLKSHELRDIMAPREESTAAVIAWLQDAGLSGSQIEDDSDWINIQTTVAQANDMLNTTFGLFAQEGTEVNRIRALAYSVPEEIVPHVKMIAPIIRFGQLRPQMSHIFSHEKVEETPSIGTIKAAAIPSVDLNVTACNASITPECLRALYNVGDYEADPSKKSLFGVCGYLEQYAKHDQLAKFEQTYAPYAIGADFSVVTINGGGDNQTSTIDDGEANLDMQYAVSMAYKTPITYYSTGGRGPLVPDLDQPDPNDVSNEPYLDFVSYLLKLPDSKLPQTITTSYGEDEQSVPRSYVEKVCTMFGALGARGVSVIFSSGDTGVGSACQTNDGKNTTRFLPIFPAACPYVTSVGGTRYVDPEVAVSFSSGGFSDIFPTPLYQKGAVSGYLKILGDRWKGLYNPHGRGFPDVSGQSVRYHVFDYGKDVMYSGTSASAPMFAALVSLLNNARLAKKLPPMGFLNPWLYTVGFNGLTDIVHGGSTGCTGTDVYSGLPTPFVPYASWNATVGWDPVTGLGTPLFDKLLNLSTPNFHLPHIGGH